MHIVLHILFQLSYRWLLIFQYFILNFMGGAILASIQLELNKFHTVIYVTFASSAFYITNLILRFFISRIFTSI